MGLSYCTEAQIKSDLKVGQDWDDFAQEPSLATVDGIIVNVSSVIDSILEGKQITPPATQPELDALPTVKNTLNEWCRMGAGYRVHNILYEQGEGNESTTELGDDFMKFKKMVLAGVIQFQGLTRTHTSPESNDMNPQSEPFFKRTDDI